MSSERIRIGKVAQWAKELPASDASLTTCVGFPEPTQKRKERSDSVMLSSGHHVHICVLCRFSTKEKIKMVAL